jgi:hypothetical protein
MFPESNSRLTATHVNSWDEFTSLREVIVGDATHSRIPAQTDPSAWLNCYPELRRSELERVQAGGFPKRVIEETNEDLADLVTTLRDMGIVVHHPSAVNSEREYGAPGWRSQGRTSYCPRDLTLIIGSTIIEVPSPVRARYFEIFGLRELFQDYLLRGAQWLSAPRPQLRDEPLCWARLSRYSRRPIFCDSDVISSTRCHAAATKLACAGCSQLCDCLGIFASIRCAVSTRERTSTAQSASCARALFCSTPNASGRKPYQRRCAVGT